MDAAVVSAATHGSEKRVVESSTLYSPSVLNRAHVDQATNSSDHKMGGRQAPIVPNSKQGTSQ
jgi:hypothetical protein